MVPFNILELTPRSAGQPRDQAVIRATRTAATNLLRDRDFVQTYVRYSF